MHYAPGGSVDGLILIEVDDLAIGTKRMQEAEFQQRFQAAFRFGKWEKREASYAGRRIRQRDQYVLVDQEKYILEKLHPISLQEKQQKDRKLSLDDMQGHARKCVERYCELANKKWSSYLKFQVPCFDDH